MEPSSSPRQLSQEWTDEAFPQAVDSLKKQVAKLTEFMLPSVRTIAKLSKQVEALEDAQRRNDEAEVVTSHRQEVALEAAHAERAALSRRMEGLEDLVRELSEAPITPQLDGLSGNLRSSRDTAGPGSAREPRKQWGLLERDATEVPGDYIVISATPVTASPSPRGAGESQLAALQPGTLVRVLEVLEFPSENRIRARIQDPAGYISMRSIEAPILRWVERAQDLGKSQPSETASSNGFQIGGPSRVMVLENDSPRHDEADTNDISDFLSGGTGLLKDCNLRVTQCAFPRDRLRPDFPGGGSSAAAFASHHRQAPQTRREPEPEKLGSFCSPKPASWSII